MWCLRSHLKQLDPGVIANPNSAHTAAACGVAWAEAVTAAGAFCPPVALPQGGGSRGGGGGGAAGAAGAAASSGSHTKSKMKKKKKKAKKSKDKKERQDGRNGQDDDKEEEEEEEAEEAAEEEEEEEEAAEEGVKDEQDQEGAAEDEDEDEGFDAVVDGGYGCRATALADGSVFARVDRGQLRGVNWNNACKLPLRIGLSSATPAVAQAVAQALLKVHPEAAEVPTWEHHSRHLLHLMAAAPGLRFRPEAVRKALEGDPAAASEPTPGGAGADGGGGGGGGCGCGRADVWTVRVWCVRKRRYGWGCVCVCGEVVRCG